MPELPEITLIAQQMSKELKGKRIKDIEDEQPKHLNVSLQEFVRKTKGKTVKSVSSKGKWIFVELDPSYFLLINLGMGAELLYFKPRQRLPEKAQFKLTFSDNTGFTIHFWWFGYVHLVEAKNLAAHKMTAQLGMSPADNAFTLDHFKKLLARKKTRIKSLLLNQKNIAGIGNVYVQDILFKARLHPNREASTLSEKEVKALFRATREVLNRSIGMGGASFEMDFYGQTGKFTAAHFLVGYKTGKPCPVCNALIQKIRTGSTASYICPECQVEK